MAASSPSCSPSAAWEGHLSDRISHLVGLRRLSIHDNAIAGVIPAVLGFLSEIRGLYLFNNRFSGAIPPEIGRYLVLHLFDASNNWLTGVVPTSTRPSINGHQQDLEVPDEYELDVCDINEKPNKWAVKTGEGFSCNHVLSMNRETLHKVVFSNITDISDVEMREVNWVLVKEWKFYYNLCKDEDFFDLDQFFVHRMKEDDLNFLAIPGEIAQGYHLRCEDTALLCSEEFDYYLYGSYSYHKGQNIISKDRWAQFCAELGIEAGSLIMIMDCEVFNPSMQFGHVAAEGVMYTVIEPDDDENNMNEVFSETELSQEFLVNEIRKIEKSRKLLQDGGADGIDAAPRATSRYCLSYFFEDTFAIPCGVLPFDIEEEEGKLAFLAQFALTDVPPIKYFGSMAMSDDLPDDVFKICFMAVNLGSFLCPTSSTKPSTEYLGALVEVDNIKFLNWCKLVHDWLVCYIKKYKKDKMKGNKMSLTLGGCIYHIAVRYLDFVDFGSIMLPSTLSRIRVWKGDLIKHFSNMVIGRTGSYNAYHHVLLLR
ncbi:hypothetical protein ACQ4PT_009763 [Festuca glaucescens]